MLKRIVFAIFLVVAAGSSYASCVGCYCDDVVNGRFESTGGWSYSGATPATITSPCGGTTKAVQMGGQNTVTQTVAVPSSTHTFTIDFDVLSPTLNGTWYDQITVTVTNLSTNYSESFYVHGNQLTSNCQRFSFGLSNSFAGANVKIEFLGSWLTATTWYLDNVNFWYRWC